MIGWPLCSFLARELAPHTQRLHFSGGITMGQLTTHRKHRAQVNFVRVVDKSIQMPFDFFERYLSARVSPCSGRRKRDLFARKERRE